MCLVFFTSIRIRKTAKPERERERERERAT